MLLSFQQLFYKYPNIKSASDDKELVMTVVAKNYKALEYVSERLKAYRDIVEATIAQDGYALLYTYEELRMNKEIILKAVRDNTMAS